MSILERKYVYRRMLPHFQKPGHPVFVTFRRLGSNSFCDEARTLILQHCLHDHEKKLRMHAAVVMPDHVHLLVTPLEDQRGWPYSLSSLLKAIKGTSARAVNKLQGAGGPVWQEESFDHVLRSDESFEGKLEYIRQNPVRRGLVERAERYPWLWVDAEFR